MTEMQVTLSREAYEVLCGLVQDSETVEASEIFADVWEELRKVFPLADFLAAVRHGRIEYSPEG